jgi:hypothetical protein
VAAGLWGKFMGLMGRASLPAGAALWLPASNGIHMMFMRFPIDAVFLDRELRVLGVAPDLRPWRWARRAGARAVLELGAGEADRLAVRPGELLTLREATT